MHTRNAGSIRYGELKTRAHANRQDSGDSGAARTSGHSEFGNRLTDPQYRTYECEGERNLLAAVIRMAVHDYVGVLGALKVTHHDFATAQRFLFGEGLESYCELLGLDTDIVFMDLVQKCRGRGRNYAKVLEAMGV